MNVIAGSRPIKAMVNIKIVPNGLLLRVTPYHCCSWVGARSRRRSGGTVRDLAFSPDQTALRVIDIRSQVHSLVVDLDGGDRFRAGLAGGGVGGLDLVAGLEAGDGGGLPAGEQDPGGIPRLWRRGPGCSPREFQLRDLPRSHHMDSDRHRLKVRRQSIRLINEFPSCKKIVRISFEKDALFGGREDHPITGLVFTLDQTGENSLGCGQSFISQRIAKISKAVCVTKQFS